MDIGTLIELLSRAGRERNPYAGPGRQVPPGVFGRILPPVPMAGPADPGLYGNNFFPPAVRVPPQAATYGPGWAPPPAPRPMPRPPQPVPSAPALSRQGAYGPPWGDDDPQEALRRWRARAAMQGAVGQDLPGLFGVADRSW